MQWKLLMAASPKLKIEESRMKINCIGDATQDQFFFISDAEISCDIDLENCILGIRYGDKIPVEKIGISVGGNAANVAVGLSRLGSQASLVTVFGDDDRGAWIKRKLMEQGVDLQLSKMVSDRESNLSTVIVYKGERTILSYHGQGGSEVGPLSSSEWIYLTSSSGRDSTSLFKEVLEFKSSHEPKLAFNPNKQDLLHHKAQLEPVLRYSEVVFMNVEEAEILAVSSKEIIDRREKVKEQLNLISNMGPKVVVITDGLNGAYARTDGQDWFCSVSNFERIEATGAGDAFTSGFLASFVEDGKIQKALSWGMVNSGSVVTKIGGQEGLLTKEKIQEFMGTHNEIVLEKI